jgi:glycine betaine/choline ABC-type transport system substrate-binding protein
MLLFTAILGISAKPLVIKNKGSKMENITVGSQFTTQKSGVSGVVQEVIENKNGTFRVRLDVAGQPRWTTVK